MLPRTRVIQVGDVHFPEAVKRSAGVDTKDPRFPPSLGELLAARPLKTVFQKIHALVSDGYVAGLIFMGDLTDIGRLDGYQNCANFIAGSLQIGRDREFSAMPIGIVAGNHDVDRAIARSSGAQRKFQPLQDALAAAGLPRLPVAQPEWLEVGEARSRLSVALLNSCWGCGEVETIPAEFRSGLVRAIDEALAAGGDEKAIRTYYDRQLDTPAFSMETISALIQQGAEKSSLLVACAHHNLLPQRLTRLAPYTELVNSGAARSALMELGRPVIYLHGHIHEDPIEILSSPGGDSIACVSAPEVTLGFNVIEVIFTRSGHPLSCKVVPWRFDRGGILRQVEPVLVPLIGGRRRSQSKALAHVYAHVLTSGDCYWPELIDAAKGWYSIDLEGELEESLELLAADGRVSIENHRLPPSEWIVGARV